MTNATIVLFIPTVKLVKGKVCCFVISTIYIIITVTVPEKSRLSLKECCTAESICAIFMGLGWRLIKISKVPPTVHEKLADIFHINFLAAWLVDWPKINRL